MVAERFVRVPAVDGTMVMNPDGKAYLIGIAFTEYPISKIHIFTAEFIIGVKTAYLKSDVFPDHTVTCGQVGAFS